MFKYFFKTLAFFSLAIIFNLDYVYAQNQQFIDQSRKNSIQQQKKPYVILISADGFRHDYLKKFSPQNLLSLSNKGVRASAMIPSFPTLTFPNHYSIATGMYPSRHGLVSNNFWDRNRSVKYSPSDKEKVRDGYYYGGLPLWVLAEKHQMLAATYYWVGSEAYIDGVKPTYSFNYEEGIPLQNRIETVINWLELPEEKRPHLITFYINEPDYSGHNYGPEAPETAAAVEEIDKAIARLVAEVRKTDLEVNFIFLSDHGMSSVDRTNWIKLPNLDSSKVTVAGLGAVSDIYVRDKKDLDSIFNVLKTHTNEYKVYLKQDVPAHLKYDASLDQHNRIGDIVLMANWPKVISVNKPNPGYHGYDATQVKDMYASFMAWGPAFKENLTIEPFQNIHVYPLVAKILGLDIQHSIDGDIKALEFILKEK